MSKDYLYPNGTRVRVLSGRYNGKTSPHAGREGIITGYQSSRRGYTIRFDDVGSVAITRTRVVAVDGADSVPEVVRHNPIHSAEARTAWRQAQQFEGIKPLAYQLYDGAELRSFTRPGAMDHEQHPSRIGSVRVWRDGRREAVA